MTEFIFDHDDVDAQAVRIVEKLAPLLGDEHPVHVTAALTLMLASYIAILSAEVRIADAEVDATVDRVIDTIKSSVRFQRAHYNRVSHPDNA